MFPEGAIISPDVRRKERIPPGQYLTKDWPVLHHGQVPAIDFKDWRFRISGLVGQEKSFTLEEFQGLPRVRVFSDIHCVTTWSRLDNLWEGVSAGCFRDLIQIMPEARFVMVHGENDFTTNIPMEDFFQEDVLFAFKHDGRELSPGHGGPVRLVVPRLYFWKSAKWVKGLEFMAGDRPGYWERNGYHMHGDPWLEERYG